MPTIKLMAVGQSPSRSFAVVLILVLVLAALARFIGLFSHATTPDEAFTFFVAAHPLDTIFTVLRTGDFHPPLIYLIGHFLLTLTPKAYLFRAVTALFGIAGVAATYSLARRVVGRWAPLAAVLVALNAILVFFDGFFRMYAPLWVLTVTSWASLLWALDEPRRAIRWVAYGACVAALMYTQYLAFFVIATQLCYGVVFCRRMLGFWIALAGAFLAFVPWLPTFLAQYPLGGTAFRKLAGHLWVLWHIPSVLLIDGIPSALEYSAISIAILWMLIVGGIIVAVYQKNWKALFLFAPVVLQVVYSLLSGKLLFGQRYFLQAVVPLVFLCILSISWLWQRARPVALAAVAAFLMVTIAGTADKHFLASFQPVDWTTYGRFLSDKMHPGDGVVFDSAMVYYVLVNTKAVKSGPIFLVTNGKEAARFGARAARLPRVWFVGYQTDESDPDLLAFKELLQSHPQHTTWRTTAADYGDVVFTTLFSRPVDARRGP